MAIINYLMESLISEKRKHNASEYRVVSEIIKDYQNREDSDDIYVHYSNNFNDSKDQLINQI